MNPKVSIITASYNYARFIEDLLRSVREQTYSPIEHIVVDGGSKDETVEILKRYESTYTLQWKSEKDRGQSHAFNKGIEQAKGEWLLFLNSDDYLLDKQSIERMMQSIEANPGYSIYMGHIRGADEKGELLQHSLHHGLEVLDYPTLLNKTPLCIHQATFTQRQVFEKVGGFSEDFYFHMDFEFLLRATRLFPVWLVDVYVSVLRKHPSAKTQRGDYRSPLEQIRARRINGGALFTWFNLVDSVTLLRLYVRSLRKANRGAHDLGDGLAD
jgi:glycosyltransferase involved in cell wall biosynthesis